MKSLIPSGLRPPFGAYSHGTLISPGLQVLRTSGQLGIRADDSIPEGAYDQAVICFEAIRAILTEGGMMPGDVTHISAYVTAREYMLSGAPEKT